MVQRKAFWGGMAAATVILASCATPVSDTGSAEESAAEEVSEIVVTGTRVDEPSPPPPGAPPAPPPPPPLPSMAMSEGGEALKSRSFESDAAPDSSYRPEPEPDPGLEPQPEPQAGLLTAGDYDDVLNPDLYQSYLDKALQGELGYKDLPYVDAARRIEIEVTDRLGKPMPLARVSLTTASGEPMFPLRTGADGKAYLYPNYDALEPGTTITVTTENAPPLTSTLSEKQLETGATISFDISADRQKVDELDLLLTLDATGSMTDEMAYLQTELLSILDRVSRANDGVDIQAGLIVYRDIGDEYVTRTFDFTDKPEDFYTNLMAQSADGGGDRPEAMQIALQEGLDFSWREDAVKVNLLVADAPPKDYDIAETWDMALISRSRGIHIVPLAASGIDGTAEFLMRAMGQVTGGRYLFLTDDSGIGNPHAEPTVDCYVVTRLDSLVQRVLESLVTGVRVEPEGEEVIRTVGNYRAGLCKLEDSPSG